MNDDELDRLIASAAAVSDATVQDWHLAPAEAHFTEAIMSIPQANTDPDAASGHDGDGSLLPTTRAQPSGDLDRHALARSAGSTRHRRRTVAAIAAAALVAAGAAAFDVSVRPTSPDTVTQSGGADRPISPASTDPLPPDATVTPEDVAALEAVPTLLPPDGWSITSLTTHGDDGNRSPGGQMTMTDDRDEHPRLQIDWGPASDYASYVSLWLSGEPVETTAAGQPAVRTQLGTDCAAVSQCTGPKQDVPGPDDTDTGYRAAFVLGDLALGVESRFPDDDPAHAETFDAILAALTPAPPAQWMQELPDDIVTPSQHPAFVDAALADIPLPPGFDPAPLRTSTVLTDRFGAGADITGPVVCRWIETWVDGMNEGDPAAVQAAADAMTTANDWDILVEMSETSINWPGLIWAYGAAINGDGHLGTTGDPVDPGYRSTFGCDN